MLTGIGLHVWKQLERTDLLELIGKEIIFTAELKFTAALDKASQWINEVSVHPTEEK